MPSLAPPLIIILPAIRCVYQIGVGLNQNINTIINWQSDIEKQITETKFVVNGINDKQNALFAVNESKNSLVDVLDTSITIGLIDSTIVENKKTSSGIPYLLEDHICETNENFNWSLTGLTTAPLDGTFFYITNKNTNMTTWCMKIGNINNTKNKERAMIVSSKVAEEINFLLDNGIISASICHIKQDEWKSNKDMVALYKKVFDREPPVTN